MYQKTPDAKQSRGLIVSIAPSEMHPTADRKNSVRVIHFRTRPYHLSVLLRNASDRPMRLWEEWNSWGFYNLTLEVVGLDDKPLATPVVVARPPGAGWGGNGPTTSELPPGECLVRDVALELAPVSNAPSVWTYRGFPTLNGSGFRPMRLRAVYSVNPGPAEKQQGVWVGRIASEPQDFLVRAEPGV